MVETLTLCASTLGGFAWWLRFVERRDVRRYEQRTELLRLRGVAAKSEDVETLKQRVARLELKGVSR